MSVFTHYRQDGVHRIMCYICMYTLCMCPQILCARDGFYYLSKVAGWPAISHCGLPQKTFGSDHQYLTSSAVDVYLMPFPKKRKRQVEGSDQSHKRQSVQEDRNTTGMLRTGVRAAHNVVAGTAARTFSSSSSLPAIANSSLPSLRSNLKTSMDRVSQDATPVDSSWFGKKAPRGPYGRGSSRQHDKNFKGKGANARRSAQESRRPPRRGAGGIIYTEEYIYNNMAIPKASEYGLLVEPIDNSAKIFEDANLLSNKQSFNESSLYTEFTQRCLFTVELENDLLITATGHGRTKQEAEGNANLHAMCILHEKGFFKDILPGGKYTVATESTLRTEGDAKKDVIDYAARHDALPVFSVHHGRSRLKKSIVTITASIDELNLTGFGRAKSEKQALLQACISLKQAAEAHHEQTGDGLLLVKDYTKLTTESSRKFLEYYCANHRIRYESSSQSHSGRGKHTEWTTTIAVAGRSQSESVPPKITSEAEDTSHPEQSERSFAGIPMISKKDSEDTAFLASALVLKKEDTNLWKSFVKEMKRGNGEILKPLRPIDIHVDYDAIETMRRAVRDAKKANDGSGYDLRELEDASATSKKRSNASRQMSQQIITQKNQDLKDAWDQYQQNPALEELRRKRSELPMVQHREDVMKLVNDNEVCVVVGATGSGKTTQLPQLILEEMTQAGQGGTCNIICTQPRRIAAISVAQRVAVERNEALQESIGYSVRFDSRMPKFGGSVNYCTTGILLRQLQDSQAATLDGISHIIIDEVHERDIQIDFLLVILRQLMADRRAAGLNPIKVIMMSATIDTTLFCKYFGAGFESGACPYIEVPGRTFPVTQHHLDELYPLLKSEYPKNIAGELYSKDSLNYVSRELTNPPDFSASVQPSENNSVAGDEDDSKAVINWKSKGVVGEDGEADLAMDKEDTVTPVGLMSVAIAHLLKTTTEGSILVFLPGFQEITALNRLLTTTKPLGIDFTDEEAYKVYLLHSAIPQMQQEVFEKLPAGKRKIILSTNIAETSITIPDVVYVVDSSKHRESQYDQAKRMSSLISTWTSKSNARQRAGRAGRVQNGHYYTMATKARYESFEIAPQPEILRTDLQELCLQIKGMGIKDIKQFLRKAIEPPSVVSVENSIDHLQALGALDDEENLTPLGRLLSTLPVQPSLGKMAILGAIFKCLDPILILAAASTAKDPFLSPIDRRAEADRVKADWAKGTGSDHAAVINAFKEWRKIKTQSGQNDKQFAFDNFLHYNTLVSIAQTAEQIFEIMQKSGLVAQTRTERGSRPGRTFKSMYGTEEENANADSLALQSALATAGFYPNIAVQTTAPRLLRTAHENGAQIHPNSLAAPKSSSGNRYGPISREDAQPVGTLYAFSQKTQADSNSVNLRSVTRTSPLAVVLFGGKTMVEGSVLRVDEWIPFFARGPQMYVTEDMHRALDQYLTTTFARLGAANQRMLLAQAKGPDAEGFLSEDKARDPLVQGIVEALELCAPKVTKSSSSFSRGHEARGPARFSGGRDGRGAGRSNERGQRQPQRGGRNVQNFESFFK